MKQAKFYRCGQEFGRWISLFIGLILLNYGFGYNLEALMTVSHSAAVILLV